MADDREHLLNLMSVIASESKRSEFWHEGHHGMTAEQAKENEDRAEKAAWDARREVSEMFDAAARCHN